jgi:hypothetical protein
MPRAARLLHQLSGLVHELIERRFVPPYLEDGNVIFVRPEKKARLASECIHVSADRNARTHLCPQRRRLIARGGNED